MNIALSNNRSKQRTSSEIDTKSELKAQALQLQKHAITKAQTENSTTNKTLKHAKISK